MEVVKDLLDYLFFGGKRRYLIEIDQRKKDILESYEALNKKHVSDLYFPKKALKEWRMRWDTLKKIAQNITVRKGEFGAHTITNWPSSIRLFSMMSISKQGTVDTSKMR